MDIIFDYLAVHAPGTVPTIKTIIGYVMGISIPVSLLLFFLIIIVTEKFKALRKTEDGFYNPKTVEMAYQEKDNQEIAKKWEKVLEHVESSNSNDWRQAIIEADIILAEVLTGLGYKGMTIGEQLKRANKGDFKTLDDAWEAHKVRNELAHSGSDFQFSQYDARQTIQKYRKVFEEFFHI